IVDAGGQAAVGGIDTEGRERQGRVGELRAERAVAGISHIVALVTPDRLFVAGLYGEDGVPAVSCTTTGELDLARVATLDGGTDRAADRGAIVILTQHDVDHACNSVRTVD